MFEKTQKSKKGKLEYKNVMALAFVSKTIENRFETINLPEIVSSYVENYEASKRTDRF